MFGIDYYPELLERLLSYFEHDYDANDPMKQTGLGTYKTSVVEKKNSSKDKKISSIKDIRTIYDCVRVCWMCCILTGDIVSKEWYLNIQYMYMYIDRLCDRHAYPENIIPITKEM